MLIDVSRISHDQRLSFIWRRIGKIGPRHFNQNLTGSWLNGEQPRKNFILLSSSFVFTQSKCSKTYKKYMGEVVNVLVAFAVIVFIFRWATSSMSTPFRSDRKTLTFCPEGNDTIERSAADTLGFRPKPVTQDMVQIQPPNPGKALTRSTTDKHYIEYVP